MEKTINNSYSKMIIDNYLKMMPDIRMRSMLQSNEYDDELGFLRRQEISDQDRELSMYQSGSTLLTVEGSLNAVGTTIMANFGGVSEEELRSDPVYISYYYSNVNLNLRLPPPLLLKEDWRFAQKLQGSGGRSLALGGIRDTRKVNRGVDIVKPHGFAEWGGDGLIGLPGLGIGRRKKSIAKIIQERLNGLVLLSIEKDMLGKLDSESLINIFCSSKC